MVGVAFAATGVTAEKQQWDFALCNFKPDEVFVYGDHSSVDAYTAKVATLIQGPEDLAPGLELVVLSPLSSDYPGIVSLSSFTHPRDNVVYWFGSNHRPMSSDDFERRQPDHRVFIETDTHDQMYSHAAWLVTAWDRRVRSGYPR